MREPWRASPVDELLREATKTRRLATRRAQVLEAAQQRLHDSKLQLAALQARIATEEGDVTARAAASATAGKEDEGIESKINERDGIGEYHDAWGDDQAWGDDHAPTQPQDEATDERLRSSANPDVLLMMAHWRRRFAPPTQMTRTQPDEDADVVDMCVDDGDAEALRVKLNEASEETDENERQRLRQLAMSTHIRVHPKRATSARIAPYM